MYHMLKFGACLGLVVSLAGCGASEHFMQDDVYNTRTPIMPPGTDLNDVTDYATFVAKKEQTEIPQERTTYVSPRQYNDFFYNSQYLFYGYSPYSPITGIGYYGYGNFYSPMNSYWYNGFGGYIGNAYHYGYSSAYYGYGYPYTYVPVASWYTPISKPNTAGNLSNAHAGTSAGRMGSTTTGGIVSYQNQLIAKPSFGFSGVGRNTQVNSSPVVNNSGRISTTSTRPTARPVNTGRTSVATERSTDTYRRVESNTHSGGNNRTINSSPRTTSPTIRSGGSSGGSVSSPGSGGSRSGGRR
ncbi:hypothetical protein [Fluviicola chungangensis]|uniref:DUF3300 domain-containing protein n=1 Tax=Fluviicola chungangensis TaxID=2597671 RepID=A0A556N6Q1_9FLAO|nr:hypothetical protein [Fluviicola chungangensis]TSJ47825.1 hypothetical protein FO442_01480 [Fluviicola chungangensis]